MANDILQVMLAAARKGAETVLEVYHTDFSVFIKADSTPVTAGDRAAQAAILAELAPLGLPIIAEEQPAAERRAAPADRFFLVDPLDGTKEFIRRNDQFTVNIALVAGGRPTHGVIVAPVTGIAYAASHEAAFRLTPEGARSPLRTHENDPVRLVASSSHGHWTTGALSEAFGGKPPRLLGSALKFAMIAAGEADLYPRLTPTAGWDTATGQAIVEAAGGVVVDLDGQPLSYASGSELNPGFIAAASSYLALRAIDALRRIMHPA